MPVGYIADWLVEIIQWSRHPRFYIHRETKATCLDAKDDAAQSRDADSQGTKSLSALVMDLLEHGGASGFRHLYHKGDRHHILGLQSRIDIDRNAAQLFGIVTTGLT